MMLREGAELKNQEVNVSLGHSLYNFFSVQNCALFAVLLDVFTLSLPLLFSLSLDKFIVATGYLPLLLSPPPSPSILRTAICEWSCSTLSINQFIVINVVYSAQLVCTPLV